MKARPRCFGTGAGFSVVGYGGYRGAYNADTDADGLLTICDAVTILRRL